MIPAFLFFILGMCLGSFASVLIHRGVRPFDWVSGHSRCGACAHSLAARDLVPVLSWGFTKGKCRYCGARVSWLYPALELGTGLCALVLYLAFGAPAVALSLTLSLPFILSSVIRLSSRRKYAPDQLCLGVIFIALGLLLWLGGIKAGAFFTFS